MSESSNLIRVSNYSDIDSYIMLNPCKCGGNWRIRDEKYIAGEPDIARISIQCVSCALKFSFQFAFEDLEQESDSSEQFEFRITHYKFAHKVIPERFFRDPSAFIEGFARHEKGSTRLQGLWLKVDIDFKENRTLPDYLSQLSIREERLGSIEIALMVMPAVEASPEVAFAALVPASPEAGGVPRYLVLELMENEGMGEDHGVVCEWFGDGERKNHERYCRIDSAKFIETLEQLFQDEQELGAPLAFGLPAWDPRYDEPDDLELDRSGYRLGLCRFAFEGIPKVCLEHIDPLVQAAERGEGREFLTNHLRNVETDVEEMNRTMKWLEEVVLESFLVGEHQFLLVHFPRPMAAPEPSHMAIHFEPNVEDPDRAYRLNGVYSCEMALSDPHPNWLFCEFRADKHLVIGEISEPTAETLSAMIVERISGAPMPECSISILEHLMLYAAICTPKEERD